MADRLKRVMVMEGSFGIGVPKTTRGVAVRLHDFVTIERWRSPARRVMKRSMRKWSPISDWRTHKGAIAPLFMAAMLAACAQGNSAADLAPAAQPAQAAAPAAPPPKGAL